METNIKKINLVFFFRKITKLLKRDNDPKPWNQDTNKYHENITTNKYKNQAWQKERERKKKNLHNLRKEVPMRIAILVREASNHLE